MDQAWTGKRHVAKVSMKGWPEGREATQGSYGSIAVKAGLQKKSVQEKTVFWFQGPNA